MDFYNENSRIAYPLAPVPQVRRVGSYTWQDSFIVDCGFIVQERAGAAVLSRVRVVAPKVVFEFTLGNRTVQVETDYTDPEYTVYRVNETWCEGYVVTGGGMSRFRQFSDTPTGYYQVSPESELEPSCVQWLYDAFVREIIVGNRRDDEYEVAVVATGFTGDVGFTPGNSAAIAVDAINNTLDIRNDLGGGTGWPCWPDGDADECVGFITTINGSGPDANYNYTIAKGNGVEVHNYPEEHRIVIDFTKGLRDEACEV